MSPWPSLSQLLGGGWIELGYNCEETVPISDCVRRWRTPSCATLESITTRTSPQFIFAFNPLDDDAGEKMKKGMVVEPKDPP